MLTFLTLIHLRLCLLHFQLLYSKALYDAIDDIEFKTDGVS